MPWPPKDWGGGDRSALQCMAELLQPMGHYARFMLKPDRT
eukprot:COSAG03_NODE_15177_length_439_cov_0.600000_1_plen_39_part_10